ncbi:MAG: hypothetical protein CL606_00190 [Anaerolineaceae bacterium]|nr:hypothetical protein [Anaerolineaceae bacterium]HCU81237.1 hypothetical protein [Chloroflexota bacterium]
MNSTNNTNRLHRLRRHRTITIAFIAIASAAILNFSLIQEVNYIVIGAGIALLATSSYNYRTVSKELAKYEDQNSSH